MNEISVLRSGTATPGAASALYTTPAGLTRPMRVILIAVGGIPAWLAAFLEMAARTGWIDAVVLPSSDAMPGFRSRLPLDLRALMAFERLRQRAGTGLARVDAGSRTGIAIAPPLQARTPPAQWQARVEALRPDLILSLGPESLTGTLAECAIWGCWDIDASLADPVAAGTSLLAPMLRNECTTAIELELQYPGSPPLTLAGGVSATRRAFWRQREEAFRKLPALLIRALHRLAEGGLPTIGRVPGRLRLGPARPSPGFGVGTRALAAALQQAVTGRLRGPGAPSWLLVLPQGNAPLDPEAPAVGAHAMVKAPRGYYWADPCLVEATGRRLLFVEEMDESAGKADIACLELREGGVERLGLALSEPQHLSFPQAFQWRGEWYMTVESGHDRRVSLYRAGAFPLGWERVSDLISGQVCVDPVLHRHRDGLWYLFVTVAENGSNTWDELFLFVGEDPTGPFRPHPANPVVSDVRRARSAGRVFLHGERLIRPAQDCGPRYGAAIVFNEILELSPLRYRERPLSRLAPHWADRLDGCHTYSASGGFEVLDAHGNPEWGTAGSNPARKKPAPPLQARDARPLR